MANSENGRELTNSLPSYYPKDPDSGHFKLMEAVGRQVDDLDDDIDAVGRANTVQFADAIGQLEELAKMVELRTESGESKERYRSRIFAEYNLNTCEGTPEDILGIVSTILNVDTEELVYRMTDEEGAVEVSVPSEKLDDINLTTSDLSEIVNGLSAAGYRVDLTELGTLEYVTADTYNNTSDWSAYPGYDTTDSNGDRLNDPDAGTYSGLL